MLVEVVKLVPPIKNFHGSLQQEPLQTSAMEMLVLAPLINDFHNKVLAHRAVDGEDNHVHHYNDLYRK